MSREKINELRNLSVAELDHKLADIEKSLHDLRQKQIAGTLDKPHEFGAAKRRIAQILTIKREKQNAP